MISWDANLKCFINPYNAIIYSAATTNRTIVPAMRALPIPAATPIMLLFNEAARSRAYLSERDVTNFTDDVN